MDTQLRTYNYVFEPRLAVSPCLRSFVEEISTSGYVGGDAAPRWLFDYSFTPYGRYGIGDNPKWKLRQAFEAHLIAPGTKIYQDTRTNTEDGHVRSIYFSFTYENEDELMALTQPTGFARFLDPGHKLSPILERMNNYLHELEEEGFWIAQGILCEVLMVLLHCIRIDENTFLIPKIPFIPHHSEFVRKVHAFFLAHISEKITIRTLADHLNISVSSASHRYRQETGETLMYALQKSRISLAKTLILQGYRLRAITANIGFCNEFHLSKIFKRIEGISPSEYRKLHRDEIAAEIR